MSLYKRNKNWWMDVRINGIRKRLPTGTENKKLAEDIYARVLMDIREGRWFPSEAKRRTFVELKERYMNEHSRINKAPKSVTRDETSFKRLSPYFGDMVLAEVTPSKISEYKSLRSTAGAAPATLSRELELLRHALNLAVREWEWLERNPFERVKIPKFNNKVERWITKEEEGSLLDASLPWLREIIIFALNTGMRQGEILSLKWTEVDLFRRTVTGPTDEE